MHFFINLQLLSMILFLYRNLKIIHSFIGTGKLKSTGPVYRLVKNLQSMKLTGLISKQPVYQFQNLQQPLTNHILHEIIMMSDSNLNKRQFGCFFWLGY